MRTSPRFPDNAEMADRALMAMVERDSVRPLDYQCGNEDCEQRVYRMEKCDRCQMGHQQNTHEVR